MDFFKQVESSMEQGGGLDILKQAQGLIKSGGDQRQQQSTFDQSSSGASQTESTNGSTSSEKTDSQDLYGSAQTLVQGIQEKMAGTNNISNAQLAGAANNILQAVKNSGFDQDNQYGQYFDKAESYLAKYKEQGSNTGTGGDTVTDSKDTSGATDAPQSNS